MRLQGYCTCPDCGGLYWRKSKQWHVCATNSELATNTVVNDATNKLLHSSPGRVDCEKPVVASAIPGVGGKGKTANRRSREAYNEYQRDYMRKKRALPA